MDSKPDREGQGRISQLLSWAGPRTVVVPRSAQGFGFTLRHFVVYPPESASRSPHTQDGDPNHWQNSTGQGAEPLDTIFVKTVREGSTAHLAGLTAGDRIVAVNGEPVSGKSYAEVIALIHSSHRSLKLLVVPRDEDILQMAYQSQSTELLSGSSSSLVDPALVDMQDSNPSPLHSTAVQLAVSTTASRGAAGQPNFTSHTSRHGTFTTLLGSDMGRGGWDEARGRREEFGRMRSTLVRDDPVARRASQMRECAGRPMSQDSGMRLAGGVSGRAKYSFGLYFPPRSPAPHSRATSADNLTHSIPITAERGFRTGSDTSSSSSLHDNGSVGSNKDIDVVGRPGAKTPSPRHSYAQSVSLGLSDYSRDGRYYVPVLTQSGRPSDTGSYGGEVKTRSSGDRPQRASLGSAVTVTTQSAVERSHRASLGSALSRTREPADAGHGHTTFVVRIPVSGASTSTPQHSYGSSFAVTRSPRHTTIDVQRQPPKPAHIEVQTGPSVPTTHVVEVQRQSPGPMESGSGGNSNARSVWQRKVLFENGQNENNVPNGSKMRNRHRTELEKLTTQRKFTSVATRMASFEKSSDEDGEETSGRENTPPTQPQPAVKMRRVSVERYLGQDSDSSKSSTPDPYTKVESKVEPAGKDEPTISIPSSGPVRIFVSPNNRNVPSPPVVEIVPVCKDSKEVHQAKPLAVHPPQSVQPVQVVQPILRESTSMPSEASSFHVSTQRPLSVHERPRGTEGDWQQHHTQEVDVRAGHLGTSEGGVSSRPQRKSSYLSAVNAPAVRYSMTPSPEHDEMDLVEHETPPSFYLPQHAPSTSVMSASDSAVNFNRPNLPMSSASSAISSSSINTMPAVVLRKKTANTVEDSMAKLHRRTSYLMATARDRSNNNASSVDPGFSPFSQSIAEEPTYSSPVRQYSLNKLKNFFGEQTPCIVEATERSRVGEQQQPESPLPDITREGPLWCKTAMSDGKKCSDRSWKQVWAVLRGHALFLIKDRREGSNPPTFSFEEPPISIKSCLVDIAHDYSRKRKHVFRLTTYSESVYLLQAEDKGTMMSWIQAIKTNNNPDNDEEGIGSAELIRRKASTQGEGTVVQISPQTAHREKEKEKEKDKDKAKKLTGISFKGKFPHSPSVRRKKPEESSGKKGGWKGRIMPRSFKKQAADDQALLEEVEDISKCTFGVPLEDCFPSPNNEFVPLIVELCTRIVEARGLDVIGVYRVPGNSVAVSHMQEELNRGIENMNMDNDKWLDVNVVSSLLKAFFRKLPQPLVTPDLYDAFIEANRNPNPEKRMLKLKRLLHTLPEHHYETFKHLAEHLSTVAAHGHANKMDAKNLAIMFGPTLIRKVEDDTVSLVTDMSDQCRIIESIILHNDWFFSNWTQDHYVPMDSGEHTQPSITDTRVPRDDDEDADSAINTKEIISSIVTAANKKLKLRQQNKSTDSLDFGTTLSQHSIDSTAAATTTTTTTAALSQCTAEVGDGRYQERSVDAAVSRAVAMTKSQTSLTSSLSASEECLDQRTTAPLATSEPDFLDWEERLHYANRSRQMTDDALLERSDEVVGGWVGRETLDWLKRLEQEARTIRRLEEQRQRDMERRRRQQQMIERELQRSQRDLEMEDTQSVEDILAWSASASTTAGREVSAWSRKSSRYQPGSKSDSALMFREQGEGASLAAVTPRTVDSRTREQGGGGKYFVSVANTRDPFLLRPASLENLVEVPPAASQFSRTGSLENMVDAPFRDVQASGRGRLGSGGLRHGSLDSLLDMLGHEQQGGGSSDSEDGSDLLTSLTTTFDQKLQILLNPKYRLSSRHSRLSHSHSRHSGARLSGEVSRSAQAEVGQGVDGGASQDWGWSREAGFRDPSLHRATKSDTKVGIASRFEWGTAGSSSTSSNATAAHSWRKPLPDFCSFLSRTPRAESRSASVVLTQPRKLSSGRGEGVTTASSGRGGLGTRQAQPDFRPISKSEKMEVNAALARLTHRDGGRGKDEGMRRSGPGSSEESTTRAEGSGRKSVAGQSGSVSPGVASPPPSSAALPAATATGEGTGRGKASSKRRHTVGGAGDLEHFKALLAISGQQPDPRPSAWDQLCPSHKDLPLAPAQGLQAWVQKERLRGSTPDLLNCGRAPQQFSS